MIQLVIERLNATINLLAPLTTDHLIIFLLRRLPLRLGLQGQVPGELQAVLAGKGVFLLAGLPPGADQADAGFTFVGLSFHVKLRYSV
jgi:hypothetical protein